MRKDVLFTILLTAVLIALLNQIIVRTQPKEITEHTDSIPPPRMEYGLRLDDYIVENEVVKPNMFLSEIFAQYKIETDKITTMIEKTAQVYDVRKMKKGNKLTIFFSKDTARQVKYIVYEKTLDKYIVFDFQDTLNVYNAEKKVEKKIRFAEGTIESSLWETLQDIGLNPLISNDLSEVYAWSIDFFGLQKGDKFKILFSQNFVDTLPLDYGKIQAAYFFHYGEEIYAIPFRQDTAWAFYNANGENLRKAFLKAPLKYSHISSGFTGSRLHPIFKTYTTHYAVDYSAPMGTPVQTIGDGIITLAEYSSSAGNWIKITHNTTYSTAYLHLSKFATGIQKGKKVKQGDVIGYVGSTGWSTGPHLDFRVYKNGEPIDPLKMDAPPAEPISAENMEKFAKIRDLIVENFNKTDNK